MENKDKNWNNQEQESDIIDIVFDYVRHWKWFVLSFSACLLIGISVYVLSSKQYKSSISILLEEDKSGSKPSMDMELLSQGLFSTTSNIENEIAILSSPDLMKIVVDSLNLQTSYHISRLLRETELYNSSPFRVTHFTANPYTFGFAEFYIIKDGDSYVISGKYTARDQQEYKIDETTTTIPHRILIENTDIQLNISTTEFPVIDSEKYHITINSLPSTTKRLVSALSVNTTSKTSSVLSIGLIGSNLEKGNAILKELVHQYNLMNVRIKNQMAYNTALFINDRLSEISIELGSAEKDVVDYKQEHKIADLSSEAELFVQQVAENEKNIFDIETQINILSFAEQFVSNPENKEKIIPNLGVSDIGLSQIITEYNNSLIKSDALLKSTGAENPARMRTTRELENMRSSISSSLENVKQTYNVSKRNLIKQAGSNNSRILSVPRQERGLVEKVREQKIKENLFLFLMQKREENNLAIASTPDKARVIVSPEKTSSPIAPKFSIIMLAAGILGLLLPIIGIYSLNLFSTQIKNRSELEKLSNVEIIGEIANMQNQHSTIQKDHNDGLAEMFRALRNNINFIFGNQSNQIILTTSTMAGEGKTFISTNLALSFAFAGKKVLLIGADIRNPQLAKYFKHLAKRQGFTDYLTTTNSNHSDYIEKSLLDNNLDIMVAGTIPPHPNELLMSPRVKEFLKKVKREYDLVILDTAPVGMVSDTYLIDEFVDLTLYITRENVTPKSAINFINLQKKEGRLINMYLVLNDSKNSRDYKYGYGKSYGYGNTNK